MLSIIICSVNTNLIEKLKVNISTTIGTIRYEIIVIDNSINNYSITQVYNQGIEKSKYDNLLFMHEDVHFVTASWGNILIDIFINNENVGLIGIAGTTYKSKYPSAFWHTADSKLSLNLIQHYKHKEKKHLYQGFYDSNLQQVVAIDGVFMALRKNIKVKFNENITGFHCYDLGISIDVQEKQFQVVVSNQIVLEHFSSGDTNQDFLKGLIHFHNLYKNKLPKYIGQFDYSLELLALKKFLILGLHNRFVPFSVWKLYLLKRPFDSLNYSILKLNIYEFCKKIKVIND